MVCQVCGAKSGFYPLCLEHYRMSQTGEVVKCPDCSKYHLKDEDCLVCAESNAGQVRIETIVVKKWGTRLFAIAMDGNKYGHTDYDLKRYETILAVSGDMKGFWDGAAAKTLDVPTSSLDDWANSLRQVADAGLKKSDDTYDIGRYSDILEVAEEITEESLSYSAVVKERPRKAAKVAPITFVSDHEIAPALIGMIDKAQKRILIASPWVRGIDNIVDKLTEAHERGVTVKVLVRKSERESKGWTEDLRRLHKKEFHVEAADFLHVKMLLVDGSQLYIGSANLLETSMERNREAGILTTDSDTLDKAARYFDSLFLEAFDTRS